LVEKEEGFFEGFEEKSKTQARGGKVFILIV
jgi:hypothetical protein